MSTTAPIRSLLLGLLLVGLPAGPALGNLPTWEEPELKARSAFTGAWNLPDSAFFTNSTVALNDLGQTAIHLSVLDAANNTQGVWMDDGETAGVVVEGPSGASLSDVSLNDVGVLVYPRSFSSQDGIWSYDSTSGMSAFVTNQPLGSSTWGSPEIDDTGRIGWRAGFSGTGRAYASFDGAPPAVVHVAEAGIEPTSPYSFLFTPSTDSFRRIAGKVRLGAAGQVGESQPDQIRIFSSDGSSVLVAEDADSDPMSSFESFDNGVTLTDSGRVAFVADTTGGDRGVFLSDGTTVRTIALESDPDVSEIEFFAPVANAAGVVAFRGKDGSGLQAIFVGDGTDRVRLIGEHDLVETDLGTARLDQHDGSPIFGGGIAIDEAGSVAFAAGLTPPANDQVEWGSGIFVADASGIFADGFESGGTDAWSTTSR